MGHRDDLLVTLNLSEGKSYHGWHHPRGSVRRTSGFVLTSNSDVTRLGEGCRQTAQSHCFRLSWRERVLSLARHFRGQGPDMDVHRGRELSSKLESDAILLASSVPAANAARTDLISVLRSE